MAPRALRSPAPRVALLSLLLSCLAAATPASALPPPSDGETPEGHGDTLEGRRVAWSTSLMGQFDVIEAPQDSEAIGGFFDQYDFTPNKGSPVPFQLAVRDASLDWIEDGRALLQFRLESPTSNLGISGFEVEEPFFNSRALVLGRFEGFAFDIEYRRLRTEQRRRFPNTSGSLLPFTDLSDDDDRFFRDRTGFAAELRWRPGSVFESDPLAWWAPELSLRGGYDARDARRQLRTILNPGNDWLAFTQDVAQDVAEVGGGLLLAPGGLFTLALDFDFEGVSSGDARLDDELPFASTGRSVGFIPSTSRSTGQLVMQGRIGERAVLSGGFQATVLEQADPFTPAQSADDLVDNRTIVYSAQLSGDVEITPQVSANAQFKFARRDNDIDRDTALFNPLNGTQVDEFLESYSRVDLSAEAVYQPQRSTRLALGTRFLWIDRNLDFAGPGLGNRVIQPENALVGDETFSWELYGRADLRPLRGLGVRLEIAYRDAPDTGYITDLDNYFQGKLRASYLIRTRIPLTLVLDARGGTGENRDFAMVEGVAPNPPGPSVRRDYQRSHWNAGLSLDASPRDDLTLFASLFFSQDDQNEDLLLSNIQRYFQESVALSFASPGLLDFTSDEVGLVVGSHMRFSERTDGGLSYSYTHAESSYAGSDGGRVLSLIDDSSVVDADIHALDIEVRHRIRDGLRVFLGYRFQRYVDGAPLPESTGSVVSPFERGDDRHSVRFGVTLNSELLARR